MGDRHGHDLRRHRRGASWPRGDYPVRHGGRDDLAAADVTGDGHTDIVVMSGQGLVPNVSVLPALANGTFGAAAEYAVGGNLLTQGIGVGDVTGDGRNDVVASYGGNSPSGRIGVFEQLPAGTLVAPPTPYQSYDIPSAVEVSDVDRDGRSDAIVVHEGWLRVGLYRGQAGGQLSGEDLYPVPFSNGGNPQGLAVGDVTADGWPDIVVADDLHGLLILPNIGEASPPSPSPTPPASPSYTLPPPTPTPDPTPTRPDPDADPRPDAHADPGARPAVGTSIARREPNLAAGVGLTWQPPAVQGTFPTTGYRIYRGTAARRRRRWSRWATCSPSPTRRSRTGRRTDTGSRRSVPPARGHSRPRSSLRAGPPRPLPGT